MAQKKPDPLLDELARKLRAIKRRRLATQRDIERVTGIDQTTISRVQNGQRRRATPQIHDLMRYADMLLEPETLPSAVTRAARKFLEGGGSEAELVMSIEHAARLVSRRASGS